MFENGDPAYYIVFIVFLFVDMLMYGFQAAVSAIDEKELEKKAFVDKNPQAVQVERYEDNQSRVNQLTSIVATLVHVIVGASLYRVLAKEALTLAEPFSGVKFLGTDILGVSLLHILVSVLVVLLMICVITTFGITLPRKLANRKPEKWAYACVCFVRVMDVVFTPLLALVDLFTNGVMMLIGGRDEKNHEDVLEQEIIDMVNEGHEQGVIEANEAEMISKIFAYGDKEAQDIMTNRANIIAIDMSTSLEDALQFMLEESYSRYPVINESIDHIEGILYLKDAMRFYNFGASKHVPICDIDGLVRKAEYTPLTRNIDDLFEILQSKKVQMAVVVDEYGQTAGLVTMEDILEEIVGKIQDEYDEDEDFIEEKSNDAYVMEGMTPLQDIEEQLGISFGDTEYETLNGFMIGLMDHIPQPDEDFESAYKGYSFKVLSIENMRVQSVLVQKLADEPEKTEKQEEN